MRYYLPFGVLFFIAQVYFSKCSESSEISEGPTEDVIYLDGLSELIRVNESKASCGGSCPELLIDVSDLYTQESDSLSDQVQFVLVSDDSQYSGASGSNIVNYAPTVSQVQVPMPMPMPMQRINQMVQFGSSGKLQWIGGPVDFESMVDCKFYRQNPGFCVPMSMYTPCSRCKARVRTIFRTSYKVRCPGQDSFPAQLRPYFAWVPTSHRNPKRERGIFSRWRRQFMCVVMALSDIPSDVTKFWQHSQISFDSTLETQQYVPLLLGPYADQSTSFGYTGGSGFFASPGGVQNAVLYSKS